MLFDVIHILLLDGHVLCVELKTFQSKVLLNHLCVYLSIKSNETFGLLYKDSRGLDQWLDDSKSILDHDIAPCNQILQLVVKIRFIPHHICLEECHIHQLMLVAGRLLRQNWFLPRPEIHSQLVALYILSSHGLYLSDSEIHSTLIRCRLCMLDPLSKDNYFDDILDAYKIYRDKLDSAADFSLKFIQLMMQFPIFNSRLFVISNHKGEKCLMGVNSEQITVFYLNQYHEPLRRIYFKDVDNVLHRDIKIMICLRNKKINQRSILNNEMVTYFALSTHQSNCIYSEIEACWNKYKASPVTFTINQLLKDSSFKEKLNKWLQTAARRLCYPDYHTASVNIHVVPTDERNQEDNEREFGETSMADSDLCLKLSQVTNNKSETLSKPTQDIEQLSSEVERLKTILSEKMDELLENCNIEKDLTGVMPADYYSYFPSGNLRFTRNNNMVAIGRQSHKGCAAEIRSRLGNGDSKTRSRAMSRDNIKYNSSRHIKGSMSPSIVHSKMKTSYSVADLRLTSSSPRSCDESLYYLANSPGRQYLAPSQTAPSTVTHERYPTSQGAPTRYSKNGSPRVSRGVQRHQDSNFTQSKGAIPPFKKSLNHKY